MEIGSNLVWRHHTDQLKDSNAPVTDNHTPVFHPLPFPALIRENHGDQVAEPTEQTEAVSRETDGQSSNTVAESSASCSPSQIEHVPVRRYPTRVRKPPARLDL